MRNEPPDEPGDDRSFVHTRLIDAPRERVFRAFSEPPLALVGTKGVHE